jgi:hypothetical protein
VADAIGTKLVLRVQQVKTVRPHKAVSLVKPRAQASLVRLVHRAQFRLPKMLKFQPLKTWSFQIRRAKARWQVQKLQMPHWCASHKLVTHAQHQPQPLLLQNQPPQPLTPKRNQRAATVVAANVEVAIVASLQTAPVTVR